MNQRPRLEVAQLTDPGRSRQLNEDAVYCEPLDSPEVTAKGLLCIVADGIGGHAAGEVASQLAVRVTRDAFYGSAADIAGALVSALEAANAAVYNEATGRGSERMGSTIVAAVVKGSRLVVAHAGDSRAYLIRGGRTWQLTKDHTWVQEQVDSGLLTAEEARSHPHRNVINRALGAGPQVSVDVMETSIEEGDALVLCSDGLSGLVSEAEMEQQVSRRKPHDACRALVAMANQRGGPDNISIVVAKVGVAAKLAPTLVVRRGTQKVPLAAIAAIVIAVVAVGVVFGTRVFQPPTSTPPPTPTPSQFTPEPGTPAPAVAALTAPPTPSSVPPKPTPSLTSPPPSPPAKPTVAPPLLRKVTMPMPEQREPIGMPDQAKAVVGGRFKSMPVQGGPKFELIVEGQSYTVEGEKVRQAASVLDGEILTVLGPLSDALVTAEAIKLTSRWLEAPKAGDEWLYGNLTPFGLLAVLDKQKRVRPPYFGHSAILRGKWSGAPDQQFLQPEGIWVKRGWPESENYEAVEDPTNFFAPDTGKLTCARMKNVTAQRPSSRDVPPNAILVGLVCSERGGEANVRTQPSEKAPQPPKKTLPNGTVVYVLEAVRGDDSELSYLLAPGFGNIWYRISYGDVDEKAIYIFSSLVEDDGFAFAK